MEIEVERLKDLHVARRVVRDVLRSQHVGEAHADAVASVTNELLVVAFGSGLDDPARVTVEPFALLTSVRVRYGNARTAGPDMFATTERLLSALTIGFGHRPNPATGGLDLWAEVPRPA